MRAGIGVDVLARGRGGPDVAGGKIGLEMGKEVEDEYVVGFVAGVGGERHGVIAVRVERCDAREERDLDLFTAEPHAAGGMVADVLE